jgi:pyruvate carboxylase subunit B
MKKFKFAIDNNPFEVSVTELENGQIDVEVNGSHYAVTIDREGTKAANQTASAPVKPVASKAPGKVAPIQQNTAPAAASAEVKTVKSQLPGSIIKVVAEVGQAVKRGDVVMTIESMKMENTIAAECDGTISKIYVEAGKSVLQDDKLFDITLSAEAPKAEAPKAAPVAAPAPAPAPAPVAKPAAGSGSPMKSPLPGSIIKVLVTEGQAVKRGETLLTMESMKMENEIKAEKDGVIVSIAVAPGQNVMQDDTLLMMA